jgi:hypothetical protein
MAVTEHNQALLNLGLVAGALYLGFKASHHGHAQRQNAAGNALNNVMASQQAAQYRRFR